MPLLLSEFHQFIQMRVSADDQPIKSAAANRSALYAVSGVLGFLLSPPSQFQSLINLPGIHRHLHFTRVLHYQEMDHCTPGPGFANWTLIATRCSEWAPSAATSSTRCSANARRRHAMPHPPLRARQAAAGRQPRAMHCRRRSNTPLPRSSSCPA